MQKTHCTGPRFARPVLAALCNKRESAMKYLFLILSLISIVSCGITTNTKPENQIGYNGKTSGVFGFNSVPDLLSSLKADTNNIVSAVSGDFGVWTIVESPSDHSLWSFTPEQHPAHPSVVKRTTVEKDGKVFINMAASCKAEKSVCDQLVNAFLKLNNKIRDSFGA